MSEQLTAQARAKAVVSQYRKDSLPYDIDQWITYAILDANKQARAEVLAACQGVVEVFIQEIGKFSQEFAKWRSFKQWNRDDWEAAGLRLLSDVQDALEKVQPAAADLEELLREAHADGHGCSSTLQAKEGRIQKFYSCGEVEPIGLEKARAEGKG